MKKVYEKDDFKIPKIFESMTLNQINFCIKVLEKLPKSKIKKRTRNSKIKFYI